MKEFPLLSMFNIHENLLESLLELQNYADVQAVLAKYDGETWRACAHTHIHTFMLHIDIVVHNQIQNYFYQSLLSLPVIAGTKWYFAIT